MADPERPIDILAICDEWKPSKGGLSAFNRELVINLAKVSRENVNIHCYVSQSDDADRENAKKNGVNLVTAQKIPGTENPHEWLKFPPPELPNIDIVIGHGRKFGLPACFIKRIMNKFKLPCKLLQFLHVYCLELGKYKTSKSSEDFPAGDSIHDNEAKHRDEVDLCEEADAVVAVGKALQQNYQGCLPDTEVHAFTPGIFDSFVSNKPPQKLPPAEDEEFTCLVCGRASEEDRSLKGYDIIADAIGSLGENFKLVFTGSPAGKQRKVESWFLKETKIEREQLTVRSYVDQKQLKKLIRTSDVVALPSRTEGFGLVALEAISADTNVLVSKRAGISRVLQTVEGGNSVIVKLPNNPDEWADRIQQLSNQTLQERRERAVYLRKSYAEKYSWEEECRNLLSLIKKLVMTGTWAGF